MVCRLATEFLAVGLLGPPGRAGRVVLIELALDCKAWPLFELLSLSVDDGRYIAHSSWYEKKCRSGEQLGIERRERLFRREWV